MTRNSGNRKSPDWLQPMWEHKRRETARRVTVAVRTLKRQHKAVTLTAIRGTIQELDGVSISTNTIQRNELAYEVYLKHASTRPARQTSRNGALSSLRKAEPEERRPALHAKISRLRRESKDTLIAKLIELEKTVENQTTRENALRDELLRAALRAPQARS
jgi:hypothetical protein